MKQTILGQVLGQVLRPVLNTQYLTDPGVGGGASIPSGTYILAESSDNLISEDSNQFVTE